MVRLLDFIDKAEQDALTGALDRICEQVQPKFENALEVRYFEPDPDDWYSSPHPFFCIVERIKVKWLGVFSRTKLRTLVLIHIGFYGGAFDKKEVNGTVYDRSVLAIVKKEIQKYADTHQATASNLNQKFVS